MAFNFEPAVIVDSIPQLLKGAELTIYLTVGGLFFGFILGAIFGLMKLSPSWVLRKIAGFYIETIRGTPMLVQAMFLYFGVPLALGIRMSTSTAGIIVIAVNSGAYIAEIVRGAVQSIDKGQREAGRSIGLSSAQTMRYVIWPQAFRRMVPPLGNQFIISLKDTSLLMIIGVGELMRTADEIVAVNYRAFEVYFMCGLIYLAMTMTISSVLKIVENRLSTERRL